MKIIRNVGDPPRKRGEDPSEVERREYRRLLPIARAIYDGIPSLRPGDAIEVEGTIRAISRIAGAMVKRSHKYQKTPLMSVRCESRNEGVVRVYFLQAK